MNWRGAWAGTCRRLTGCLICAMPPGWTRSKPLRARWEAAWSPGAGAPATPYAYARGFGGYVCGWYCGGWEGDFEHYLSITDGTTARLCNVPGMAGCTDPLPTVEAVSYTHLTLPTSDLV